MWMMGYNDNSDFNMIQDTAFTGRKIRPLVPRPNNVNATNNSSTSTQAPPCFSRIHAASDLLAQYHQLGEQRGMREFNTVPQVMVSSRWNPKPEQLRALEELYRRGTRTPSAEQIQQITSQLRRFGKIEGKNVFYWFQNHKARERQKRRRKMESHDDIQVMCASADHQKKESSGGASRTVYGVEETKNWAPSKNCTTTTSLQYHLHQQQETVKGAESRTEGWVHFDEEELHQLQRRNSINPVIEKNATWQNMMQLSPPPPLHDLTYFISATTCPREAVRIMGAAMDHKLINNPNNIKTGLHPPHDLSIFVPSYMSRVAHGRDEEDDKAQTLELFPLRSNVRSGEKDRLASSEKSSMNANPSYQFFEFIPLKN